MQNKWSIETLRAANNMPIAPRTVEKAIQDEQGTLLSEKLQSINHELNNIPYANLLQNPTFSVATLGDFFIKKGCKVYNEPSLVTDVTNLGLSNKCRKIYYKTDTYASFLGDNDYTYYVNINDIEKKYVGADVPTVNGWRTGGYATNTVIVHDNYITIGSNNLSEWEDIFQTVKDFEVLKGHSATYSVKLRSHANNAIIRFQTNDGEVYANAKNTGDWEIVSLTKEIPITCTRISVGIGIFQCTSGTIDIAWAKLELGDKITTFFPPNKDLETMRCEGYPIRSNPNLFDNPDFGINQRKGYITKIGGISYLDNNLTVIANENLDINCKVIRLYENYAVFLGTDNKEYYISKDDIEEGYISNGYACDRWKGSSSSVIKILKNGVKTLCYDNTHNQGIRQFLKYDMNLLVGKSFTLSLEVDTTDVPDELFNMSHWLNVNGVSIKIPVKERKSSEILTFTGIIQYLTGIYRDMIMVQLNTLSGTLIKWAKFELGDKATPYVPPNHVIELIKCKYYYQEITINKKFDIVGSDRLVLCDKFSNMRITPTVNFKNNKFNLFNHVFVNFGGAVQTGFNFSLDIDGITDSFCINADKTAHGTDHNAMLIIGKENPLCLDAEIY